MAGIAHTTVDGRILDCNEPSYACSDILPCRNCRIRSPQLYFDPADRDGCLVALRRRLKCGSSRSVFAGATIPGARPSSVSGCSIPGLVKSAERWSQRSSTLRNASSGKKRYGKAKRGSSPSCGISRHCVYQGPDRKIRLLQRGILAQFQSAPRKSSAKQMKKSGPPRTRRATVKTTRRNRQRPSGGSRGAGNACRWPAYLADLQISHHRKREGGPGRRHRN